MMTSSHQTATYRHLEKIGRIRLSQSFLFREFLHSEIAETYGLVNSPSDLELAVEVGTNLCIELLEPIQAEFGRLSIRSGYRSAEVNALGHRLGLNCASNQRNAAAHIWDMKDQNDCKGATACVVIPAFWEENQRQGDWQILANWIDTNLPYSTVTFFPKLWAFNIQWHQSPKRKIKSYAKPRGRFR